jgi:multiple sugar transport system permease protein
MMFVPIIMVIVYAFLNNINMTRGLSNSRFVGIFNFTRLIKDAVYMESVRNTLVFTVINVIGHMVVGMAFALLLNTKMLKPVVKAIFRVIYILPWVFTATVVAVMWKLMLNPHGFINYFLLSAGFISKEIEFLGSINLALLSITFINIWCGYPFYMVCLLAGLQGISQDLYEAGTVDGANGWQRFLHITIPQLKPLLLSMGMMDFIWTMQQFNLVWMSTGGGPVHATEMVNTYTYKLAFQKYEFSQAAACGVVLLVLSMCLSLIYVRVQKASE